MWYNDMKRYIVFCLLFMVATSLAISSRSICASGDDIVTLRINARVTGRFTIEGSKKTELKETESSSVIGDSSKITTKTVINYNTESMSYNDYYSTDYTALTKWKIIGGQEPDSDRITLELVSDKYSVSGYGNGVLRKASKTRIFLPSAKGKAWERTSTVSKWTQNFPQDSKPTPPTIYLSVKNKSFRIELNSIGPESPTTDASTTMTKTSPNGSNTMNLPGAGCPSLGSSLCSSAQIAAVHTDNNDKRLTGKFDPKKSFVRSGSAVYNASETTIFKAMMKSIGESLGTDAQPNGQGMLHVSYTLYKGEPADVEAEIDPKGDYEGWLPLAGTQQDTAGNKLAFDIKLIDKKTKKAPKDLTAYFEISLHDTSKEPGSCMNSPWADTTEDFKIAKEDNSGMDTISPDGQNAKSKDGIKSIPIVMSCYDGAAYSKLKVVAHLSDGRELVAHLKDKTDVVEVAMPFDENNNKVADAWEKDKGVYGKSLDSDDDEQPLGDHNNGDGLTNFEEYRGFLENGKYIRTDPKQKDFFVCDTIGGKTKAAIARFESLTKLKVHSKLTLDELSESRIINRNHSGDAAHVVDQHGIIIVKSSISGECRAVGGPGTPASVSQVLIGDISNIHTSGGKSYEYYIPTVAHELLHCCNVWHHGESDKTVYWKAETVDGNTRFYEYDSLEDCGHPERGSIERIYSEKGGQYDPSDAFWSTPQNIWLGVPAGQHSGNEDCVMRYDASDAYVAGLSERYYLDTDREVVGQGLCSSPDGTGVNAADRKPQPRYYDADITDNRGDCIDKYCVNDLYNQ